MNQLIDDVFFRLNKRNAMSIMKFILFALLVFGLWVTEPLWMKASTTRTTSPMDIDSTEEEKIRTEKLDKEVKKLKELETKFGPKPYGRYSTGVPSSIYEYWNKTLQHPDSIEEERCGPIELAQNGWTTVCRYRVKNSSGALELIQDTFTIKNGIAYK